MESPLLLSGWPPDDDGDVAEATEAAGFAWRGDRRLSTKVAVIVVTSDSREELNSLCEVLLAGRLVACAQISGPISSRYWWAGRLENAQEWVATLKTTPGMAEQVRSSIAASHSYEVPEILLHEVSAAPSYAAWVQAEVSAKGD